MESPQSSYSTNKVIAAFYRSSDTTFDTPAESLRASPVMAMLAEQRQSISKCLDCRILSTSSLVAITYMLCCGTPDRNDVLITYGGPLPAFGGLMLFTVVYVIPFSYVVAELCTAFPDDGGVAIWVKNAFGPFWGFQTGFWVWVSLICACVTSPAALYDRVTEVFGAFESPEVATMLKMAMALLMALPCFFGTRVVSKLSLFLMIVVLTPFVALSTIGFARAGSWGALWAIRRTNATMLDDGTVAFAGSADVNAVSILKNLFYCFDGIVLVSVFGGEVANPSTTYATAIFVKLAFHFGSFLIPLSSAVVYARPEWYHFGHGAFMQMANSISTLLGNVIQLASDCSTMGVFVACMFSQAYLLCGMAHSSMIPRQLSRRNERFGTPNLAGFCGAVVVMVCIMVVDPPLMGSVSSALSSLSQLVVIVTVVRLRFVLPQASRPTRVTGNGVTLCIWMAIPVLILGFMVYTAFSSLKTAMISLVIIALGWLMGIVFEKYNANHPLVFEEDEFPQNVQQPMIQMG